MCSSLSLNTSWCDKVDYLKMQLVGLCFTVTGQLPPGQVPPGQLPPRTITPQTTPPGRVPPGQFPPR